MTFKTDWFSTDHVNGLESLRQLPAECIADCSGSGDVTGIVEHWVNRLGFDGPPWIFRKYLRGFGVWDEHQLCNHTDNRNRVLWLWAGYCSEDPGNYDYLWLES